MGEPHLTKNERRQQAREQARLAREAEKKREKRNRLLLQGGVVLGIVAILAIVAIVIQQSAVPTGQGPRNMASGGVVFEKDLKVRSTPALSAGKEREAVKVNRAKMPLDVTVYVDYTCPHCAEFEQAEGTMLEQWVGSGDANLQIYPVNILDTTATANYSTRAANLLMCAVDAGQKDGAVFRLHNSLLSKEVFQGKVQVQGGLSDDELLDVAQKAGVKVNSSLKSCVTEQKFGNFVSQNTKVATQEGILGLAKGVQLVDNATQGTLQPKGEPQKLRGTPLVIVNGVPWTSSAGTLDTYMAKIKSELEAKKK